MLLMDLRVKSTRHIKPGSRFISLFVAIMLDDINLNYNVRGPFFSAKAKEEIRFLNMYLHGR
jgi:hypothetical protein